MDWRPFRNLRFNSYDIMVIWDYRDITFNWAPLLKYDEICLVAWSMGVFEASQTIHEIEPRITTRIAIAGTLEPIHDTYGIPTAIYHGTLDGLSPTTLRKFYRRMCTSAEEYARFRENAPQRRVNELIDELSAIETQTIFHTPQVTTWDCAVIGRHDGIFPPANQMKAWRQVAPTVIEDMGHLPDFERLISRYIIDKHRVAHRFESSQSTYKQAGEAQQKIAQTLNRLFLKATMADKDTPIEGSILEIGPGCGALTRLYAPRLLRGDINLWDIADIETSTYAPNAHFTQCDAEVAIRRRASRSLNYLFSSSTIQWFNSPASFLRECDRVLVPGGYLVLSTFVNDNLSEVSSIIGDKLNLPSAAGWQSMIPATFTLYICQASSMTLTFDSPREVIEHLRDTGVNALGGSSSRVSATRRLLKDYSRDANGKYPLTYRPIFIIARKNDPTPNIS